MQKAMNFNDVPFKGLLKEIDLLKEMNIEFIFGI